jgi:hypothetical protein
MKRMTKWRVLGFVLLLLAAAFAVLLSFPFLKEGSSWGEIPLYLGIAGACIAVGAVWWVVSGFSWRRALLGWLVLLVPITAHLSLVGGLVFDRFQGERDARRTAIAKYSEEPIAWPGFDGPVGLRIELELNHREDMTRRLIDPPEIRMGPELDIPYDKLSSTQTGGSGYFKDFYLEKKTGNLALLKTVLNQRLFENTSAESEYLKWNASARFNGDGTTRLTYFLLPGIIDYLGSHNHICLNNRIEGLPSCGTGMEPEQGCGAKNMLLLSNPIYHDGSDLTAFWMAWPGMDLSAVLTEAMRAQSALQSKPADWTAMQKRLEPAGLVGAGYSLCEPGKDSHTAFRICFCRAAITDQ